MVPSRPSGFPWRPDSDEIGRLITEWSPWLVDGRVPADCAPPFERPIVERLAASMSGLGPKRFHVVIGPRRVGKTTAMYQVVRRLLLGGVPARRIAWMRMDHPHLIEADFGALVRGWCGNATAQAPTLLFVDELCYARDWDLWLKTIYDENWPVQIIATSSATADLKARSIESGVGRWVEHYLGPFLLGEALELLGTSAPAPETEGLVNVVGALAERELPLVPLAEFRGVLAQFGGFPDSLLHFGTTAMGNRDDGVRPSPEAVEAALRTSQEMLHRDAVEKVIYKDIPQAFGVNQPMLMERILYSLALHATGILSPTNLGREIYGLNVRTFERYLDLMERSSLVFTVPKFSSAGPRLNRGRKIYFQDGAVRNAALQRGPWGVRKPEEEGILLENLVASHLETLCRHGGERLYYWRKGKQEVDFIVEGPRGRLALEVGRGRDHHRRGVRSLVAESPGFRGHSYLVLRDTPLFIPAEAAPDGIGTMPLDLLLMACSLEVRRLSAVK